MRRIANPTQPNPLFCGLKILIIFCVGLQIRRNRGLQIRRNRKSIREVRVQIAGEDARVPRKGSLLLFSVW